MKYQYWLSNIPGVGSRTIHKMTAQAGCAQEIYFLKKEQLSKLCGVSDRQVEAIWERKKNWDLDKKYEELTASGIAFFSYEMETYPMPLRHICDAPYSFYVKGRLPNFAKKRVAIVGARMCSEYGRIMAQKIAEKLAEYDVSVISGMAYGIDAYGHLGALGAGGDTYAVLGCGVNVCYPSSNRFLYDKILQNGGILSEYPPHTKPIPQLFPARNRIISGLSDAVVVVEARERSGSLITADFALEQGKDVYAVPGRVTDALSAGCNGLIRQGAGMIGNIDDFLRDLNFNPPKDIVQENFNNLLLEKDESMVYACLSLRSKSMEELLQQTKLTAPQAADILQRLMQKNLIKETFKNYYMRKI